MVASANPIPGLKIVKPIGSGASSQLFLAEKDGAAFVLKWAHATTGDKPGSGHDLHAEGAMLARLSHPGLARVHDFGTHDGRDYIIMEHVPGLNIAQWRARHAVDEAFLVNVAARLAEALAVVHRMGLVHRDVKPENVLISPPPDGSGGMPRVVLIDFGLAVSGGARAADQIAGSAHYLSPEQSGLLRSPIDGRSDLYSLGCLLYFLAAGRPPYDAPDLGELIRMHAVAPTPRADDACPALSGAVADVIARLMAKDPAERFASAQNVQAALRQAAPRLFPAVATAAEANEIPLEATAAPSMQGRASEMTRGRHALARMQAGKMAAVLIVGEPGIGKSRLAQALVEGVRTVGAGPLTLAAKCARDSGSPYGFLREAIQGLAQWVDGLEGADREETLARCRRAGGGREGLLAPFDQGLARLLGAPAGTAPLAEAHDRFAAALVGFFRDLARSAGGLVVWVDDVPWIDNASFTFLQGLAERAGDAPILILMTGRDGAESREKLAHVRQCFAAAALEDIGLSALDAESLGAVVRDFLGEHPVDETFVAYVTARATGSPFAAMEIVRAALAAKALRFSWGRWRHDAGRLATLSLPQDVMALVTQRLLLLDEGTRDVLAVAAVIGVRFTADFLVTVAGGDAARVYDTLLFAARERLVVQEAPGSYRFVHDRIREALLERMPGAVKAARHRTVAMALDARVDDGSASEDVYAVAYHFRAAQDASLSARVHATNLRAGLKAIASYAFAEAAVFLEAAREAAPGPDGHVLVALAKTRLHANRIEESKELLRQAIPLLPDPEDRVAAWLIIARINETCLEFEEGHAVMRQVHAERGSGYPRAKLPLLLHALACLALFPFTRRGAWRPKAAGAKPSRAEALHDAAAMVLNLATLNDDRLVAFSFGMRAHVFAKRSGDPARLALSTAYLSLVVMLLRWRGWGRALMRRSMALAEASGDKVLVAECEFLGAAGEFMGRDPLRGIAALKALARDHREWLPVILNGKVCMVTAYFRLVQGHAKDAAEWVQRTYGRYREGDAADHPGGLTLKVAAGAMASFQGDVMEGKRLIEEARALKAKYAIPSSSLTSYLFYGLLDCYARDEFGAEAEALMAEWRAKAYASPWVVGEIERVFYVVAAHVRCEALFANPRDAAAWDAFRAAAADLRACRGIPIFDAHHAFMTAVLAWRAGDEKRMHRALADADAAAMASDCPWVLMASARLRGRRAMEAGDAVTAAVHARAAKELAEAHGFKPLARRIETEFALRPGSVIQGTRVPASPSTGIVNSQGLRLESYLNALLQVSEASSQSLDPDETARLALHEIIRIMGAERGAIFLAEGDVLALRIALDYEGRALAPEALTFSRSVVEQARAQGEAVIFTRSAQGDADASTSIVAQDLRSIMAAPIMLGERLLGAVYLDSRVIKGLFSRGDIPILNAIASHIAIGIEGKRFLQREWERRELMRDLEVAGAVQSLLLPRQARYQDEHVRVTSHYQSASRTGGDWWVHHPVPGGLRLYLGDVTGHGVGAAMVTAAVAGAFQGMWQEIAAGAAHSGEATLERMHRTLVNVTGGEYWMTMAMAEIELATGRLSYWHAGSPPLWICGRDGRIVPTRVGGTPLGATDFALSHGSLTLAPGDRLAMFTDGVYELENGQGQAFGFRRLRHLLTGTRDLDLDEARGRVIGDMMAFAGGDNLADDVTLILVEFLRDQARAKAG